MSRIKKDEDREERIVMEVVVDAYDSEERAMGWYYYVAEGCRFPFKATCIIETRKTPLKKNEEIEVLDISEADYCNREIFVAINWNDRTFAVPLSHIAGIGVDHETQQVIEDWHYWIKRGYEF